MHARAATLTRVTLRSRPWSLLALLGLGLSWPAAAEAPDLYSDALGRIDGLYLKRAELSAEDLFSHAARELEDQVEWLMVEQDGATAVLRIGDGEELGSVTVGGWNSLARSLRQMEGLVLTSGREIDPDLDLPTVLLKGATEALDKHSRLLYGERLKAFDKRLKGTFFGIGARISVDEDQRVYIKEVFEGNPAAREGLEDGDVLLRIDGQSTTGMSVDDAVSRLTGQRGSFVEVVVERVVDDIPEELSFTIQRDEIEEPNLDWRVLPGQFGYIHIDHFSELTEQNLSRALIDLDEQAAMGRGLVIDLRGNTGGSMMQSARAADAFLSSGDLVRTVGRDGGKVRGLVEHIWAEDEGHEPQLPIVILQNHRTASGSEILAGSLRELDRAVLIGTRSYGKGTVQKVYTLRPDTRLKLTVAEYLLAGGLSIDRMGGIPADLPVGRVVFAPDGVALLDDVGVDEGPDPLLFVHEEDGWRQDGAGPPAREDPWLDLAVRVLAQTESPHRDDLLEAAGSVRELVRAEEEQRLIATFAAREIDWSPAPGPGAQPQVDVHLTTTSTPRAGQATDLVATVTNTSEEPLYRVLVRLDAADRTWDSHVLPVGYLGPGETRSGTAVVDVRPDAPARESSVAVVVEADQRPPDSQGYRVLGYAGGEDPPLALELALEPSEIEGQARALVRVTNLASHPLLSVRVRFEYPESAGIELSEYDAAIPVLDARATREVSLGLDLSGTTAQELPMHVIVGSSRFGEIVDWPVSLPREGVVDLRAPTIQTEVRTHAPVGDLDLSVRVEDESALDHVIVWTSDDKLAYRTGVGRRMDLDFTVPVESGRNRFVIEAIDDEGLRSHRVLYVRGESSEPVTAEGE